MDKVYMCIDLKSFYASVECRERNLDPLTTNLVVADSSRTEKTICLAVSPSLKKYGLSGRSRLYEVVQKVRNINRERKEKIKGAKFRGKSSDINELEKDPYLEFSFIIAKPRMAYYLEYSTNIYKIYLKYISKDDIVVYSIDEVFCDITNYLKYYNLTPTELVTKIIKDVYTNTKITATAGIGTNLYLAKIAMDIVAKHAKSNAFGVRIAYLDEIKYRKELWDHKPLTDFWRLGKGIASKLSKFNINTMGEIASISLENEQLFFKLFGVNAELLIDHAWGYEPTLITDIMKYKPKSNSLSKGQVLHVPYDYLKARIIVREMADSLTLDLVNKKLVTKLITLTIGYDVSNVKKYDDLELVLDHYGRTIPKHSHGTITIDFKTSNQSILADKVIELYDKIVNKKLDIRRLNVSYCDLVPKSSVKEEKVIKQISLFDTYLDEYKDDYKYDNSNKIEDAVINIKNKFGKNSILKGIDLLEGATAIERNKEIGGHHE